jgi:Bacterial protein of unknown function (DUF882)
VRARVVRCLALACALFSLVPWHAHARPKKRRAPVMSQRYIRMRNGWHARPSTIAMRAYLKQAPWPALVLSPVGTALPQELMPLTEEGTFDTLALEHAAVALADKHTGATHPIEPRLLDLVYQASRHFRAPKVHVVSGYRDETGGSRHAQGRAIDIALPGVTDRQLAAHLRKQGFVGVGLYTRSGFVHLDVRERSYFWVDTSAPNQRSRPRAILSQSAQRYDMLARQRGVVAVTDTSDAPEVEAQPEALTDPATFDPALVDPE